MTVRVRLVGWQESAEVLQAIRCRVFIEEQHVPPEIEQDGLDGDCLHVLAEDPEGRPIGTARLRGDGGSACIQRMAVLREQRGRGVGATMLQALTDAARAQGVRELRLHAQLSARAFYERAGWQAHGEEYLEAGIPHVDMRKSV
jgi:predicted GNAT family N-acyltransferase